MAKQLAMHFEGVPKLVFSCDWVTFTVWGDNQVMLKVLGMLGMENWDTGNGGRGYKSSLVGLDNLRVYVRPVNGGEYFTVDVPGRALERVGMLRVVEVLTWLQALKYRWNMTRLDLAFDTRQFTNERIWQMVERGKFTCNVHRKNIQRYRSLDGESDTIYFGSPQSLARLRVYRKTDDEFNEIMGSEPFTRFELQLRKERAHHALLLLLYAKPEVWVEKAAALLLGFIRFEGRWWQRWLGQVQAAWAKIRHEKPTVRQIEAWLHGQVVASLACYVDALSQVRDDVNGIVDDLLRLGREKYKSRHRTAIQQFREHDLALFAAPHGEYQVRSTRKTQAQDLDELAALFNGA